MRDNQTEAGKLLQATLYRRLCASVGFEYRKDKVKRGAHSSSVALGPAESQERDKCEEIIRHGWGTFLEVGSALARIRDKRLYRDCYSTFEEYCRRKWELSRAHAYRMIDAAAVVAVLSPIGDKLQSESQVRALAGLAPRTIPEAWRRALEIAGTGKVTARIVKRAAEEFKHETEHSTRAASPHKHGSLPDGLKLSLKLIEEAEAGARAHDWRIVLEAHRKLHECLLALRIV